MKRAENAGSRRSFLQVGSMFGLSLPALLPAEATTTKDRGSRHPARNMILLWLGSGPATIDMWDLKPRAPAAIRGEFAPTRTSVSGLQICEHLPEMAKIMHKCTLIRSLKHSIPAHGPGSQYVMTGHLPSAAIECPSLGSMAVRMLASDGGLPSYVTFGDPPSRSAGYLGSAWNAFELDAEMREMPHGVSLGADADMTAFEKRVRLRDVFDRRFDDRSVDGVARGLGAFQKQAVDVLKEDSIRSALDIESASQEERSRYGSSAVALNALRARRLIESGVRFVTVAMDGGTRM